MNKSSKDQLPSVPERMVSTPAELAGLCEHLAASGRFAFDTEFIGETSYQPILCLVQVATEERVELIDPMALPDLQPLWRLMADPAIVKICHAGDQDFAIVWQKSGLTPANLFDTQIAAGMIALGYPLAYWRLVEYYCGVELDKAHTYSAWNRRPLSRDQFAYAVDDVRYLPRIYDGLHGRLADLGHLHWMDQACDELCRQAARRPDPRTLFMRIKGAAALDGRQLAVLREVAALREQLAFEHDLPPRTMLRDEALMDIAGRLPKNPANLAAIRSLPREEVVSYGDQLLAAVERGRNTPPEEQPSLPIPGEDSLEVKRLAEQLTAAAHVICLGQSVSPGLATSQAEITALARRLVHGGDVEAHVLMTGWHRECLGRPLLDFASGRSQLRLEMPEKAMRLRFE